MNWVARIMFEASPWSPFWTAWSVGYAVVGNDGRVYLTEAGEEYLSWKEELHVATT